MHKPLFLVLLGEVFAVATDCFLFFMGFRVKRCQVSQLSPGGVPAWLLACSQVPKVSMFRQN